MYGRRVQVTVRLVGADEQTAMYLSPAQFSWLPGTGVAAVRSCPVVSVFQGNGAAAVRGYTVVFLWLRSLHLRQRNMPLPSVEGTMLYSMFSLPTIIVTSAELCICSM